MIVALLSAARVPTRFIRYILHPSPHSKFTTSLLFANKCEFVDAGLYCVSQQQHRPVVDLEPLSLSLKSDTSAAAAAATTTSSIGTTQSNLNHEIQYRYK